MLDVKNDNEYKNYGYDIEIEGVKFFWNNKCGYRYNYLEMFRKVESGELDYRETIRFLVKNDLFFVVYFIIGWKGSNHPFIVDLCNRLVNEPEDRRLLVAARGHGKSVCDTVGNTIRYVCNYPERTTAIFSYTSEAAEAHLGVIKSIFEKSKILIKFFPEIFYETDGERSKLSWSLKRGLLVKRKSSRLEMTVEAHGLWKQPTGKHFDRIKYDDIITIELSKNPDIMVKTKELWLMSQNLVSSSYGGAIISVTGTPYHHHDLISELMRGVGSNGYKLIKLPATSNGLKDGEPVFLTKKELDEKRNGDERIFRTQQLLDPTPMGDRLLRKENLRFIMKESLRGLNLYKCICIDPAGISGASSKSDWWAVCVVGFDLSLDEKGYVTCYVLDFAFEHWNHSESMEGIYNMFIKNHRDGIGLNSEIRMIGVERVGMSSVEIHIGNMLKSKGYDYSLNNKKLVILTPKSRSKSDRIEQNLMLPLNSGNVVLTDGVSSRCKDILFQEMDNFQ